MRLAHTAAVLTLSLTAAQASAGILGFTEDFSSGAANWRNSNGASVLAWSADGGPDGAAYVTSTFNLLPTTVGGFPPTVIRAASSYGSSGGAYAGDWISAGVTHVSFMFRHDLGQDLTITGRFATPVNTPGASVITMAPVASGVWTQVTFDVSQGSSNIVSLGGGTYQAIFSNIGNMQLGFMVPTALAGQNIDGHFSMTNFTLTPAPGAVALIALAGVTGGRRRRGTR